MFVLKVTRVVSQSCSLQSGPGTCSIAEVFVFTPLARQIWTRTGRGSAQQKHTDERRSAHTTSAKEFTYCVFHASSEPGEDSC